MLGRFFLCFFYEPMLWVSGVLVLEFAPILAWYRFSSCWSVCDHLWCIFRLMMCQMFSIGEISGLQAGQFSTWTLLLWSHAVIIAAVCAFALSCWNTHHLEGSICCSKTFIYLSAFIVPYKTCKLPIPCAQWQMTESCQWLMQCHPRARRPQASKGLRPCPLRTEISPVSPNSTFFLWS